MKLGGYAHTNGITFFCDVFKLKTTKGRGSIKYKVDWIIPAKWLRDLENKPIIGGISLIYYQWKIIDLRVRMAFFFLVSLFIWEEYFPIPYVSDFFDAPIDKKYFYGGILLVLLIGFKRIGRLLRYHGAEHKVINCFLKYGYVEESLVKKASRFNKRCGSNIVMIFLALYSVFYFIDYDPIWLQGVLLIVTLQVFKVATKKDWKYAHYINLLQWVTVWEPTDEEISVAVAGFNKLQQCYSIYQKEVMERSR